MEPLLGATKHERFTLRATVQVQKRVLEFYPVSLVVGWSYAICTAWSCAYCVADASIFRLPQLVAASSHGLSIVLYSAIFGAAAGSR